MENSQLRVRGHAQSASRYAFLQQSGADAWNIGQQAIDVRRSGEPDPIGSRFGLPVSHAAAPRLWFSRPQAIFCQRARPDSTSPIAAIAIRPAAIEVVHPKLGDV